MLFSSVIPAFATGFDPESSRSQIPVIRVLGDGEPMYDAEGNKLFHIRSMFNDGVNKDDTDTMAKMTEENCHTEKWEASEEADNRTDEPKTLLSFLTALFRWFASLFKFLKK